MRPYSGRAERRDHEKPEISLEGFPPGDYNERICPVVRSVVLWQLPSIVDLWASVIVPTTRATHWVAVDFQALVAQRIEHRISNPEVVGSIPTRRKCASKRPRLYLPLPLPMRDLPEY